jgi:hypothetical protein
MARETDLKYVFATDPLVTDDSDSGYARGDDWLNTATGEVFHCNDDSVGAAVWSNMSDALARAKKANLSATAGPTINDDVDLGYNVGSVWVDTTNGDSYICVDNTDGAAVWKATSPKGGGKSMVMSFAAGTDLSLITSTIGYELKAKFPFAGTDEVGDILEIHANLWKNSALEATGQIRIVDASNGDALIAELTGVTNLDEDVLLDLGTITNLPTTKSTFEVQMGRSAGANRIIECTSIELVY